MKENKIIKKIINYLMDFLVVIFGIIFLISIYNVIQVKVLKNDYSSFFGYSLFEVQTGSMEPSISAGDWIVVKNNNNFNTGDIITFKQDDEFITHRIVEAYKGTYVTRGDANNSKDDPISKDQIVGKVKKIWPALGILRKTIFNPFVLLLSIGTLYFINSLLKDNKEKINVNKKINNKINESEKNNSKKVQEELDKVINDEINVKQVNKVSELKTPEITNQISEEDYDKTLYFRMVKVDKEDLEINNIEIPEDEIITEEQSEEEVNNVIEDELKVLNNKKKNFKNVVLKAMFMKEEELKEIIGALNTDKLKVNEATIQDNLIKCYIDARYYNNCGEINVNFNGRNITTRLTEGITEYANKLIKQYKGNDKDYNNKVNKFLTYLVLIIYLEQAFLNLDDVKLRKQTYKNKILKHLNIAFSQLELEHIVNDIISIQKKYQRMLKFILDKLNTNMFNLIYNDTSIKNLEALELKHNLNFSKVYSDYIVDKTYFDSIIAEDKMAVLINLLSIKLISNMYENKNNKYLLYIPESIYKKDTKLEKIFKMLDDFYIKNNVIILVQYERLVNIKKQVKDKIKEGYKFAVDLEENDVKVKDQSIIGLMDYIFIPKKRQNGVLSSIDILASIPENVQNRIVYEDIVNKIGNYWGD